MSLPTLSLVIPTRNERENIPLLAAALDAALRGVDWQALFVDDSTDGTDQVIAALAQADPRFRLLHRADNHAGLAGAVVAGLAEARGAYIGVLDADLQHPPEALPALLASALANDADIVVASRYTAGAGADGLDGPLRQFCSRGLRGLTLAAFPRRLVGLSDPLGGFFLLRGSVLDGVALRPVGYKILLEILIRCPWRTIWEEPYQFQPRQRGQSKADLRQGVLFLRHLCTLLWDCSPSCTAPRRVWRLARRHARPRRQPSAATRQ